MNKVTRLLAMTGMAIVASATFAGPAMAASATPSPTATKAATVTKADRSKIVDFYRTAGQCERAGRIGEFRDRWDDHDCFRVRSGFHRSRWALRVSWDNHGHGFPGHGFPGHGFPGHGHGFPGDDHGFPGHGFPGDDHGFPGDDHGFPGDDGHHGHGFTVKK